jgi:hypothetical protein
VVGWNSIAREDILRWSDFEGAGGRLPELIRRLVHETAFRLVETLDFPGGSGVTSGGFDGFVRATASTPFVPSGPSVWELSVRKDAIRKADSDFTKRDSVPDGSDLSETTYIQVISRPWIKASDWASTRSDESSWKRVEAYNVDRLTAWVEQAPATRIWLLEQLGKPVVGVASGSDWWAKWSNATEPALTPEIVLARSGGELQTVLVEPGIITVGGAMGVNEITACVLASAETSGDIDRTVGVEDRGAWQRLLKEKSSLILVAADSAFGDDVAEAGPHTIVLPVPQSDSADVVLDLADSEQLAEKLKELTARSSYDLGALARRSFVSFRRQLAKRPELMRPDWALGAVPRSVRTALLLVQWSDTAAGDRAVVEQLAGMSYDTVREELLRFTTGDDPLLALTTDRWLLVSPADAWQQLGRSLLTADLDAFNEVSTPVLSERDPAIDLDAAERWRAGIDGKVRQFSEVLRVGVATGLALLGAFGERVVSATGRLGEHWAVGILRPVLTECNADPTGKRWASIAELLPLLVEAAPNAVLESLRLGSSGDDPVLATIFQDDVGQDSLFGPSSPHSHVLWTLETVAWSPDHVGAAVDVVSTLVGLDPGGRLANRPSATLEGIFCPWHPDTAADVGQRLALLDRIRRNAPDISYDLLIALIPNSMGTMHLAAREPSFRSWKPTPYVVLRSDLWRFVEEVLERLIADAGANGGRWAKLLDAHQHLPSELRSRACDALRTLDPTDLEPSERHKVWESLRKIAAHHREYADTDWSLPGDEIDALDLLAARWAPESAQAKHQWLFETAWIELGDGRLGGDLEAYDKAVADRRAAAMADVLASGGLDAVSEFADQVDASVVGVALAQTAPDPETTDQMLGWFEHGRDTKQTVAANYLWRLGREGGLDWARFLLASHADLSAKTQATIIHNTYSAPGEWEEVEGRGTEVSHEYWKLYNYLHRGQDFPAVLAAAEKMMAVGRWAATLHMLSMYKRSSDVDAAYASAVAAGIEGLLTSTDPEVQILKSWNFRRLFAILDSQVDHLGVGRVASLQWPILPALGYDPPTTTLHQALADDPAFFVEILSLVVRPRNLDGDPVESERNPAAAQNAFRLLQSWKIPPGQSIDGSFDLLKTRDWIDEVTPLLVEAQRLDAGMGQLGQVLIHTPVQDGMWPSVEVAGLIEDLANERLDGGIDIGLSNSRGVSTRSLTEGGVQELDLAEDLRKRAVRFRDSHPRTARILNSMAESYEADARREDREAERRRRGLD